MSWPRKLPAYQLWGEQVFLQILLIHLPAVSLLSKGMVAGGGGGVGYLFLYLLSLSSA